VNPTGRLLLTVSLAIAASLSGASAVAPDAGSVGAGRESAVEGAAAPGSAAAVTGRSGDTSGLSDLRGYVEAPTATVGRPGRLWTVLQTGECAELLMLGAALLLLGGRLRRRPAGS
jgi:hypothetical protein